MDQVVIWLAIAAGGFIAWKIAEANRPAIKPEVVCPHCQTKGQVSVGLIARKKGLSGGKATGALMTGGASMLLTGLSRKQGVRHMSCGNCEMEWDVE